MDFNDPLRGYHILRHPSPDTDIPSAPASPKEYGDLQEEVEVILDSYVPLHDSDDTTTIFRTFLKYLCKQGQMILMSEIIQLRQEPVKLRMLRDFLVNAILKPMKISGGKAPETNTPSPIKETSHASDLIMTEIEPSLRKDQTRMKKKCLIRDSNRCVITGMVDMEEYNSILPQDRGNLQSCRTECAHILPFALRKFNDKDAQETETKAIIWSAIHRYFPFITDKIKAETINKLENAMTLDISVHYEFGQYTLALEPTSQMHRYRTHCLGGATNVMRMIPVEITLQQSDELIPLPDPDFLRVHFQVSKILQVSGIGKKLDDAIWENEYNTVYDVDPHGSTDLDEIIIRKMLMNV